MDAERSTRDGEPDGLGLDWHTIAGAAGIDASARLLLALSGGRDSVALFHLLVRARPRPDFAVAHVDHGWRGERSQADARFCAELARAHGVPFQCVTLALDGAAANAEARARTERYRALVRVARESGRTTLLTAHHEDDVVEGLVLRMRRHGEPTGFIAPEGRLVIRSATVGERRAARVPDADHGAGAAAPVEVVRPLAATPRAALERFLAAIGATWCEDETNADTSHARNAVRAHLAPRLDAAARSELLERGRARAALDAEVAALVPVPEPLAFARFTRAPDRARLGAAFDTAGLRELPVDLAVRVLAHLCARTVGAVPRRAALARLAAAVASGATTGSDLAGGWHARVSKDRLLVLPPDAALGPRPAPLTFDGEPLVLADGRRVEPVSVRAAAGGGDVRVVRPPAPGDRWCAAPGRPLRLLTRHLAELGVPAVERARVVVAADEHGRVLGMLDFEV